MVATGRIVADPQIDRHLDRIIRFAGFVDMPNRIQLNTHSQTTLMRHDVCSNSPPAFMVCMRCGLK